MYLLKKRNNKTGANFHVNSETHELLQKDKIRISSIVGRPVTWEEYLRIRLEEVKGIIDPKDEEEADEKE